MAKKSSAKKKSIAKVKSFRELYELANGGNVDYQKLCICALSNLGCDHLASKQYDVKWKAYYQGLLQYVEALCSEYGESEDKAFKEVLAEVNNVRDCIDQIGEAELNWKAKENPLLG